MEALFITYWKWFIKGSGGLPGYRRILNKWIIFHLIIGVILAIIIPVNLSTTAGTVFLPLVSILVGLSFAWAGNAQGLMQTSEISQLADHLEGGYVEYIYTYQTAILTILVTLVLWALAGLKLFESFWPTSHNHIAYFIIKIILYSLFSLTLRECWHVVLGASWMLQSQKIIRDVKKRDERTI